jgi:hypothetical protein
MVLMNRGLPSTATFLLLPKKVETSRSVCSTWTVAQCRHPSSRTMGYGTIPYRMLLGRPRRFGECDVVLMLYLYCSTIPKKQYHNRLQSIILSTEVNGTPNQSDVPPTTRPTSHCRSTNTDASTFIMFHTRPTHHHQSLSLPSPISPKKTQLLLHRYPFSPRKQMVHCPITRTPRAIRGRS